MSFLPSVAHPLPWRWIKFGLIILLLSGAILTSHLLLERAKDQTQIYFFDVGQGDSILIQNEKNTQILIDGGPSPRILEKLGQTLPFYDRTIELMILTHPDKDHLFGLIEVLKYYQVKKIIFPKIHYNTKGYQEFIELIQNQKIKIVSLLPPKRILFEGGYLDILYPLTSFAGKKIKNSNQVSIVSRLTLKNKKILLTGDLEKENEITLIKNNIYLISDILKVAHHGSKNSTSSIFLKAVHPQEVIISVGKDNPYHHPHPELLKRLKDITIHRTDQEGNIVITD